MRLRPSEKALRRRASGAPGCTQKCCSSVSRVTTHAMSRPHSDSAKTTPSFETLASSSRVSTIGARLIVSTYCTYGTGETAESSTRPKRRSSLLPNIERWGSGSGVPKSRFRKRQAGKSRTEKSTDDERSDAGCRPKPSGGQGRKIPHSGCLAQNNCFGQSCAADTERNCRLNGHPSAKRKRCR